MVIKHQHSSFSNFFTKISPLNTRGILAQGNIFRGESSASYSLLPSVLRTNTTSRMGKHPILENITTTKEFVLYEHSLLEQFCILANNSGLAVPNNYSEILRASQPQFGLKPVQWISPELENLAALAQHYMVPTRCLDWSQDIYTAIYFAVIGACKRIQKNLEKNIVPYEDGESFVIWVLKRYNLNTWPYPIRFIVPPYNENPNLGAQRGVLTYWHMELDQSVVAQPIDRTPLDELVKFYWQARSTKYPPNSMPLEQHIIPITECIKAYLAVRNLGYTASKLFPGYAGAARELEEEHIITFIKHHIPQIFP